MRLIQIVRGFAKRNASPDENPQKRNNVPVCMILLALLASVAAGCGDNSLVSSADVRFAPAPLGFELTPLQQQLLTRPTLPQAAAGRPATRADLEEARSWFGPGELEAVLAIVNRSARARGADTLQHCFPLCDPGLAVEHGGRWTSSATRIQTLPALQAVQPAT